MRLKSFRAPTVAEAMKLVRDHFGDSAVIVSTQRGSNGEGVRVTAAIEDSDFETDAAEFAQPTDAVDTVDAINQALDFHGVPSALADRLLSISSNLLLDDPAAALAVALDAAFAFDPLPAEGFDRPLMLVGPPGTGKTVTLAKLAVRATFARQPLTVITTDTVRAGGIDQLAAFTRLLQIELQTAEDPEGLSRRILQAKHDDLILVDSVATNPINATEMSELNSFIQASGAEPVLVLNAGMDAAEAREIGLAFRHVGCSRMLITRTDAARRLGSVLGVAHEARYKLSDTTNTPHVTHGLNRLSPMALARMMLPESAVEAEPMPALASHSVNE